MRWSDAGAIAIKKSKNAAKRFKYANVTLEEHQAHNTKQRERYYQQSEARESKHWNVTNF